jgi:hypothetical protein
MRDTMLNVSFVLGGLIYALLHTVGLVATLKFRRVSRHMALLVLGFVCGILLEVFGRVLAGLTLAYDLEAADVWIMSGELMVYAVIVVGLACVFVDLRERLDLRPDDFGPEDRLTSRASDDSDRWWERRPGDPHVQRPRIEDEE